MNSKSMRGLASPKSVAVVLLLVIVAAAVWSFRDGPQRASAQPANDNFANGTGGFMNQSTAGATLEAGEPQPCGNIGATVWFTIQATVDANYIVNTVGSDFNTVLAVYTGSTLTNLKNIACNDDFSGLGDKSQVSFRAVAGVTYRIQVGGSSGGSGMLVFGTVGAPGKSGIPTLMNYQGRLTNPMTGNPVADGNYNVTFRIFDQFTGGTQQWTETQKVAVSGGLFNVLLGTNTALTASVFNGTNRFLEVQVAGDPAMTPRQRLATVPYAMQADGLLSTNGATLSHDGATAWTTSGSHDVAAADIRARGHLFVNHDGPEGISRIHFFDAGIASGAQFAWDDPVNRFETNRDLFVNGAFTATGTKNAIVTTSEGSRLTYAVESTGVWFEDFGSGQLEGGRAVVPIDSLFAETVNTEVDYHVFLTPLGESAGLYVADKRATSFEVRETDGSGDTAFDYRIVAKRRGYEDDRLEPANVAADAKPGSSSSDRAAIVDGNAGEEPAPQAAAAESRGGFLSPLLIGLLAGLPLVLVAGVVGGRALARRRS